MAAGDYGPGAAGSSPGRVIPAIFTRAHRLIRLTVRVHLGWGDAAGDRCVKPDPADRARPPTGPDRIYRLHVVNQHVYLALGLEGLRSQQVAVDGFRLAVPLGQSDVGIVDVPDRSSPTPMASYNTPGRARAIAMSDDLVVVADGSGLVLLRILR